MIIVLEMSETCWQEILHSTYNILVFTVLLYTLIRKVDLKFDTDYCVVLFSCCYDLPLFSPFPNVF